MKITETCFLAEHMVSLNATCALETEVHCSVVIVSCALQLVNIVGSVAQNIFCFSLIIDRKIDIIKCKCTFSLESDFGIYWWDECKLFIILVAANSVFFVSFIPSQLFTFHKNICECVHSFFPDSVLREIITVFGDVDFYLSSVDAIFFIFLQFVPCVFLMCSLQDLNTCLHSEARKLSSGLLFIFPVRSC